MKVLLSSGQAFWALMTGQGGRVGAPLGFLGSVKVQVRGEVWRLTSQILKLDTHTSENFRALRPLVGLFFL